METTDLIEPVRKMAKIEHNNVENNELYLHLFDSKIYINENYEMGRRWHNLLNLYNYVIYENNLGTEYEELLSLLSNIVQDHYYTGSAVFDKVKDLINNEINTFYKTHNDLFDREYIHELIKTNRKFTLDMIDSPYKDAYYMLRSEFIQIFINNYTDFMNLTNEEKIRLKEFSAFYFPEGFYSYIMLD